MTLEEARAALEAGLDKGTHCPCCEQYAKICRRKLNSGMTRSLISLYKRTRDFGDEWIDITKTLQLSGIIAANANAALLRHWGLLEPHAGERRTQQRRAGTNHGSVIDAALPRRALGNQHQPVEFLRAIRRGVQRRLRGIRKLARSAGSGLWVEDR